MQVTRGFVVDPQVEFIQTEYFREVINRALLYLKAGMPVHLQGPSGTGKTTCALHLAKMLDRPVVVMFGNDQYTATDLVGRHFGVKRKLVIDQYIRTVERREEQVSSDWVDGRLVAACKEGYTLVYDEFSRSRPETNNGLLSVLEEGMLELPVTYRGEKYIKVHHNFRAIFTSNPEEYAGVHLRPDALLDRMVTIDLTGVDEESELAITMAKTGLGLDDATTVVTTVRRYRREFPSRLGHSIRASLMIASVLKSANEPADPESPFFERLCADVLNPAVGSQQQPLRKRKGQPSLD
jgi:nitric oxide reductase NorQ protein